jgi:hypothetical protein
MKTYLLLALFWAFALPVVAQTVPDETTVAAARELAQQGIEAYQAAHYTEAQLKLEKAYRLFATPTLGLWSARARMQLGQWLEAAERYREALRASAAVGDSAMQQRAQKEADEELAALTARMPAVTVELEGADQKGVSLSLDGAPLSNELFGVKLPMNPGTHRIAASRGSERAEVEVKLVQNEHKHVPLRLAQVATAVPARPVPRAKPALLPPLKAAAVQSASEQRSNAEGSPVRPLAIAALSLGGASIAVAGVLALLAQSRCSGGECASEADQSKYDPLRGASIGTFWAGAVLAVGGTVGWLVAPTPKQAGHEQPLTWNVGPLGVSVSGSL